MFSFPCMSHTHTVCTSIFMSTVPAVMSSPAPNHHNSITHLTLNPSINLFFTTLCCEDLPKYLHFLVKCIFWSSLSITYKIIQPVQLVSSGQNIMLIIGLMNGILR